MSYHALPEFRQFAQFSVLLISMLNSANVVAANDTNSTSHNSFVICNVALGMPLEQVLKIYPVSIVEQEASNRNQNGQVTSLPELTPRVLRYKGDADELTMSFEPSATGGWLSRIKYEHALDPSNLNVRSLIDGLISEYGPYDRVLYRRKMEPAGRIVGFDWYSGDGATLRIVLRNNHHKSGDNLSLNFLARVTSRKTQPILGSLPLPYTSGANSLAPDLAYPQSQLKELFNPLRMRVAVNSQLKRRTSCL